MNELKKEVKTTKAPNAAGPYSQGIIADKFVFVAGQAGKNPDTKLLGSDIKEQTRQTIKNIESILEEAGSSLENLVRVEVYLSDMKNFAEMNEVYKEMIPSPFPTRTTVGVNLNGLLVEITAMALLNDAK